MRLATWIKIAIAVLIFSAIMDLILWFTIGYMVPCWVVSGMTVGFAIALYAIKILLEEFEELES
jgi:hypothetical protein